MILKYFHIACLLLLLGLTQCSAQNTVDTASDTVSLVRTSLDEYNLKGPVKEITVSFERFYDTTGISFEKQAEYEMKNFWEVREFPMGKWQFSPEGFHSILYYRYQDSLNFRPVDRRNGVKWMFDYSLEDYKLKKKIKGKWRFAFPVFDPYSVLVNHKFNDLDDVVKTSDSYTSKSYGYILDAEGNVDKELFILGDSHGVDIRKTFAYDEKGRVARQNMLFKEWIPEDRRLFNEVMLNMTIEVPINAEVYYTYTYDDADRVTLARLVEDGSTLWQEEYFYEGDSRRPNKLKRFVVAGRTFGKQYSDDAIEWYNEFGDILKVENYDAQGNLIRTQFYDYEYDGQNNWTVCKMYLGGQPDRTEKPTIIAYRDIEYYKK